MTVLTLAVVGLYLLIAAGLVLLGVVEPTWIPFIVVLTLVVVIATISRYGTASGLMLNAVDAEPAETEDHPELHAMLERLSALADLSVPSLSIVESPTPNAFTVGVRRRDAIVVVTSALPDLLTSAEVEAVLAHELAHVANRDAGVMTFAGVPRTLGETLIAEEGAVFYAWFFIWWLGIPIWALGSLITLTLSRYREFAADRGSAVLTGRPADMMSALVKLTGDDESIPNTDLRKLARVEALWVVATGRARFAVFSDHPPLAKRLARLEEMSRTMGEPDGR
jgi:heat shock protein HtpX